MLSLLQNQHLTQIVHIQHIHDFLHVFPYSRSRSRLEPRQYANLQQINNMLPKITRAQTVIIM